MTIQAHSKSSVSTLTALVHPNGNLSDLLFVNMVLRHQTAHPAGGQKEAFLPSIQIA